MAKSLLQIGQQYRRICEGWDRTKHSRQAWRRVYKTYTRYLSNIAAYNGVTLPEDSNHIPSIAARIAFPIDYWRLSCEYINNSNLYKVERDREYPRSIYAKTV